jgi:hypothetical protein
MEEYILNIKEFKEPSAINRPAPFWSWNDKLNKEELLRQINEMADKGWSNYFIHSRVGLVTGYLSEEWMDMVITCAKQTKKTNTYAWLYDEDKWPSGFAGGKVPLSNQAYRSRALVFLEKGKEADTDTILTEIENEGRRYTICKRVSPLGDLQFNKTSYVDLMNPETVKTFLNCTHEQYKKACGKYFGKEIPGIFTDEPCYLRQNRYDVPVLPWSECLPDFFEKLNGYDIEDHLEQLFINVGDYRQVRYDFHLSATKLFLESFTKQYYDWCEENGLIMTGHFMCEDDIIKQTQWIGAAMPHYQYMHWPGVDKLCRNIEQLMTIKQVTSVVDQLEKERSLCEVFGCVGQHVSFYHRKWIADWQAALGISLVNSHLSLYSMRGERKRDFPANIFYQQPWWDEEKGFSDYIGRLSYAVSAGKREVNILVIHPIGTVWSEYNPLDTKNSFTNLYTLYNKPLEELSKKLMGNKLDFHYGDEILMEEHASVTKGKFILGAFEYDTVIIPPCNRLTHNTVRLLKEFARMAGNERLIVMEGSKLTDLSEFTQAGTVSDVIKLLDEYYPNRIKTIDKITGKNSDDIFVHERNTGEGKSIFIANTNKDKEVDATLLIPETKDIKVLDLMNGEAYNAPAYEKDSMMEMDILFQPGGSVLLIADGNLPKCPNAPVFFDSGVAFSKGESVIECADKCVVDILDENVLLINNVTLFLNGQKVLDNKPISMACHDHFYKAEDGTPFVAEYEFESLCIPEGEILAIIESAENLGKIMINGEEVKPRKCSDNTDVYDERYNWKDVNFVKVPITGHVIIGKNILRLEGVKINNITGPGFHIGVDDFKNYKPTEVEAVYIVGNFYVESYDRKKFVIANRKEIDNTRDIAKDGYHFYSGKACYKTKIECNNTKGKTFLKIDDANCACMRLIVNGKYVGTKLWYPFVYNVSDYIKEGKNDIEIIISSTLFNLMGPNRITGILDDDFVGPRTFIEHNRFTRQYASVPFGLGKVYLEKIFE